jgi:C4-dicarboxylate transporter
MGPVIPIAGFFFIGSGELASRIFGTPAEETPSFLFDLILAGQSYIPENAFIAGFGILLVGMITGLDGSGFSGLPLVGALSGALGDSVGVDPATLAAIGQMGAIWVGGGTLIAWSSLVAVAGFAKVPVMELVRRSFVPVIVGLVLATVLGLWMF